MVNESTITVNQLITVNDQYGNDTYNNSNGVYQPSDHSSTVITPSCSGWQYCTDCQRRCLRPQRGMTWDEMPWEMFRGFYGIQ